MGQNSGGGFDWGAAGGGASFAASQAAAAGADALKEIIAQKLREQQERRQQAEFQARLQQQAEDNRFRQLNYDRQLEADKVMKDWRAAEAERDRAAAAASTARTDAMRGFVDDPTLPEATRKWLRGASLGFNQLGIHDYENPDFHRVQHVEAEDKRKRDAAFDDFKRRADYTATIRAKQPQVGRLVLDDPTLPIGVQSHLTQIRQRNPDFNSALTEFQNSLAQHQQVHPKLSPIKAVQALQRMYTGAGRAGADDDLDAVIDAAMTGDNGRGMQLRAPGLEDNAPNGPQVRNSNGQSEAQLQQAAAQVLRSLGKDASPASVQRFLANPQNRRRLLTGGR